MGPAEGVAPGKDARQAARTARPGRLSESHPIAHGHGQAPIGTDALRTGSGPHREGAAVDSRYPSGYQRGIGQLPQRLLPAVVPSQLDQ